MNSQLTTCCMSVYIPTIRETFSPQWQGLSHDILLDCYMLHMQCLYGGALPLLFLFVRLSIKSKQDEAVRHALDVRSAVSSNNYLFFFRLYEVAPNLNTCLMGKMILSFNFSNS
jgi:hypothetical protein